MSTKAMYLRQYRRLVKTKYGVPDKQWRTNNNVSHSFDGAFEQMTAHRSSTMQDFYEAEKRDDGCTYYRSANYEFRIVPIQVNVSITK